MENEELKKIHKPEPDRVVFNVEGEATHPDRALRDHNCKADVVFVRNDGWSLGTPFAFVNAAFRLWHDEWTYFYFTSIGDDKLIKIDYFPVVNAMTKERR